MDTEEDGEENDKEEEVEEDLMTDMVGINNKDKDKDLNNTII